MIFFYPRVVVATSSFVIFKEEKWWAIIEVLFSVITLIGNRMQCLLFYAFQICKNCVGLFDFIGLFVLSVFFLVLCSLCIARLLYRFRIKPSNLCISSPHTPTSEQQQQQIVRQFNNRLVCHKILLLLGYKCVLQMVAISGLFGYFRGVFFAKKKKRSWIIKSVARI